MQVLICFPMSISLRKYEGACVVPLFCEVNSVSLHVRQLAKMAGVDQKGRFFRRLVKTNIGALCCASDTISSAQPQVSTQSVRNPL